MSRLHGIVGLLAVMTATLAAQSKITRIEFSPVPEPDGGGIEVTLVGAGECSYTLDYGDGKTERRTATLPASSRHNYAPDREYTVVATPEAPCEGIARARLDIRAISQGISKVTVEPGPSASAAEIVATIEGRGTCVVTVDFGDGTSEKVDGALPAKLTHAYPKPGSYELRASTVPPCRGDVRMKVYVRQKQD
jgi:hypothetical protein